MNYLSTPMTIYIYAITFLLGLVMGSFCNAWAWRIVNHEKIQKGRSHCTVCNHTLSALDLVPLFSWLFLKGKCRYCGSKISPRYPIAELILGVYFVSILAVYGFSFDTLRYLLLGCLLFVASLEDIDSMEIQDYLLIPAAILALLRLTETGVIKDMLLGLIVPVALCIIVFVMEKLLKREAMGGADIKIMFIFALHFGLYKSVLLLVIACIIGLIMALISKKGFNKEFPFGPSLALSSWLVMLFGNQIIDSYLALL